MKDQLYLDMIDAMNYLMKNVLISCSNNPKSLQIPIVRLTNSETLNTFIINYY